MNMERCRLLDKVDMPAYMVGFFVGACTAEEMIQYNPEAKNDIENANEWLERFTETSDLKPGEWLLFDYANDEHPEDSSFTPYPIFGLACDTIEMNIYAINDNN